MSSASRSPSRAGSTARSKDAAEGAEKGRGAGSTSSKAPEPSWWQRVDRYQRRHRWAGFPLGVIYKYGDDQGNYLAALITYYAFLSLFPLLLLASSILGFVLQNNPELQQQILDSTLARFPVIGTDLQQPGGLKGSGIGLVVGVLASLYGGLGVANATQNALNIAWAVPRGRRPNPIMARLRSVMLLAIAGMALLATTLITNLHVTLSVFGADIEHDLGWLITFGTVLLNGAIFTLIFKLAAAHEHAWRKDLPGGLFVAVIWQLLQYVGEFYVGHVIKDSSAIGGVFAVVLGMFAWFYVGAVAVVLGIEVNVVRAEKLYPRSLLTPFTDDVELTEADRRVYTGYAQAQGHKTFQSVDVTFDESGRQRRRLEKAARAARRERERQSLEAGTDEAVEPAAQDEADEPAAQDEPEDAESGAPHEDR